ncbi:nucleolar protein NET1-like [Euphorbia lathyris]|uniref:nucleolar protein NET1-like n=1 Tax=Euphorbia lathyris TaxID=212925 RepID=UPI00331443BC
MPSGAKKRKQAKKKKEQLAHTNGNNSSSISDTHSQGNDDPKSQDERDSDGGELGSPASQDHQNQHRSFNEENEESEKSVQSSFVAEDNPIVRVEGDVEESENTRVESTVEIQREVKLENNTESIDVGVEHVEFSEASHNGDDKSSSSSSSDDESQAFDENVEEVKEDPTIEKPLEANGNSVTEASPAMDWVTHVVPMSEVAKHVTQGANSENAEVLDVVESGFKVSEDNLLSKSDVVAPLVPEENEEKVIPILYQNAEASTIVSASDVNGNEDSLPKSSISQTSYEENIKDSEASGGTAIKNEVETLPSSVAHTSDVNKDINKAKDFEASENIETQPLVPPAPRIAQRTSFFSCCGLLDAFTGSNR